MKNKLEIDIIKNVWLKETVVSDLIIEEHSVSFVDGGKHCCVVDVGTHCQVVDKGTLCQIC